MTFWRGGAQITSGTGPLGQVLSPTQPLQALAAPVSSSAPRGGIWLEPVHMARAAGGRIVFKTGGDEDGELALVYTIFGGNALDRQGRQAQGS